jgi:hypothetical protein
MGQAAARTVLYAILLFFRNNRIENVARNGVVAPAAASRKVKGVDPDLRFGQGKNLRRIEIGHRYRLLASIDGEQPSVGAAEAGEPAPIAPLHGRDHKNAVARRMRRQYFPVATEGFGGYFAGRGHGFWRRGRGAFQRRQAELERQIEAVLADPFAGFFEPGGRLNMERKSLHALNSS